MTLSTLYPTPNSTELLHFSQRALPFHASMLLHMPSPLPRNLLSICHETRSPITLPPAFLLHSLAPSTRVQNMAPQKSLLNGANSLGQTLARARAFQTSPSTP